MLNVFTRVDLYKYKQGLYKHPQSLRLSFILLFCMYGPSLCCCVNVLLDQRFILGWSSPLIFQISGNEKSLWYL